MSSELSPFIPAALDDADLTPHEFRVFCHIARRGECLASIGKMSDDTGVSEPTLRKALKTLRAASMVEREKRPGTTDKHRTVPPDGWDLSVLEEDEDMDPSQDFGGHPSQDLRDPKKLPLQNLGDHPLKKLGGHPSQDFGVPSKGNPFEGNPFEGAKHVSAAEAPLPSAWREVIDQISWQAQPLPDDHPVRWDHLPGDWTFDFAAAALEHFRSFDLLGAPTQKKIQREGEDYVIAQWGDTFRLLHEQDGYSRKEIKATMEWLFQGGNFWIEKQAIRSVPPLRSKTSSGDAYKFDIMHQQAQSTDEQFSRDEAKQRPDKNWKRLARAAASA
jgi:DNA-binding transcriptional ArsR family regulator